MKLPGIFSKKPKKVKIDYEILTKNQERQIESLQAANLRLIAALREMDQGTFQIFQVAPDWKRIQPIFQKMFEATEKRMAMENDRIKNLMVGEIATAYNDPRLASNFQVEGTVTGRLPRLDKK